MSLGSIVVRLSMNTADFETDAGRAAKVAQRRAKEIDDAFRRAGKAIGVALGTAASAAIAGTVYALGSAVNKMDETYNAAKKVGESTENFSRLQYAAGLADVGMDQLVSTLGKLTKAQAAALKDGSQQAKVFEALGISATNADGSLRAASDVMLDFADRFAAMKGSPEAMAAGFELFGRSFQDMIPLLEMGSEEIRRLMGEADALGITLSESAGAAADQFKDQLDKLQLAVGGIWKEIAAGLLPALDDSASRLTTLASDGDLARNATTLLSTALSFGVGALEAYNDAVARASINIEGFVGLMSGLAEAQKNVMTLGMADGSVIGGYERAAKAVRDEAAAHKTLAANRALSKAGMTRDQYNKQLAGQFNVGIPGTGGSMFPALPFNFAADQAARAPAAPATDYAARVAAALAASGGGSKGRKAAASRAPEISEEAKAMERLNEQATRELESLRERLGLMGLETEAAKMKWETEEGAFKALDPLRKAELVAQAALVDAKQKAMDVAEDERRAAEDASKALQQVLGDLKTEHETLGMTNDQLEIYNRLKWAGVDANSASGQAIIAATKAVQEQRKAIGEQIERMDGLRSAAGGFLDDLRAGENVWDALKQAASDFAGTLADIAQRKLIEQIFGQTGSAQGGSGGGWLGSLVGIFGGLFGGGGSAGAGGGGGQFNWVGNGYATGGYTGHGGRNEPAGVVHKGEVVWSQTDIARAGGVGAVEAMRRGRGSSRMPAVINVNVPRNTSYETAAQAGSAAYAGATRAARRNG